MYRGELSDELVEELSVRASKRLERLPPYLFAELERKITAKKAAGVDVISLGIGDPDTPTPPRWWRRSRERRADPGTHQYPSNRGRPELREALARFYARRFGVELDPDTEIVPALGAKEAVFNLNLAFLDPGDAALAADPGYPVYTGGPLLAGGEAVLMPLLPERGFAPDLEAMRAGGPRACPADVPQLPEQPDRRGRARRAVRGGGGVRAPQHDVLIVHDASYTETTFDGYVAPSFLETPGAQRRGHRGVLALQGLEHDRLAHRRGGGERGGGGGLLAAEDEHRLGHVRGGAAGRGGRARRGPAGRDDRDLRAPPRPGVRRARARSAWT